MLNAPVASLLFKMAAPTVVIQLITIIYNTADTYFVAKIDTSASAAVGVVFALMAIIQAVGYSIGMGTNSLISRRLGAAKEDEANKYASSAILYGAAAGCVILILGIVFMDGFLRLLGASDTVLPYARDYALYILIGAPFMCVAFILNNILRSEGQAFFAMIAMIVGGVLNMILDPVFIFACGMGISGAALATMISQIVNMIVTLSFFLRGRSIVRLNIHYVSRNFSDYLNISKIGIPTLFRQGLSSLATALLNNQAMPYGDAAVAAMTISNKVYLFVRGVMLGIGQGYQPIAGFCFGAGNKARVKKFFRAACVAGTAVGLVFAAAVFVFRVQIMTFFRADPEVIRIGSDALAIMCVTMPLFAYSTFVNQTYQCLGFPLGATILASCRQGIFFIPLNFLLPALLHLTGIEMVQAGADFCTFFFCIPFQVYFFKKHLKS